VCFYVNKLLVSGLIGEPVNKEFELLFETGVDEMNWDDLHEGEEQVWPELEQVIEYRQQVYEAVTGFNFHWYPMGLINFCTCSPDPAVV